jgi:haloalkane dehalogenase
MLPEMDNREAVLKAYSHAFPNPKSRIQPAQFPQEITDSSEWLADIESRLPALKGKPVEFIFGLADKEMMSDYNINKWKDIFPDAQIQALEHAKHFTQEDSPESYVIAISRLLKLIGGSKEEVETEVKVE